MAAYTNMPEFVANGAVDDSHLGASIHVSLIEPSSWRENPTRYGPDTAATFASLNPLSLEGEGWSEGDVRSCFILYLPLSPLDGKGLG